MRQHILRLSAVLLLTAILPVTLLLFGLSLPSYYQESYYAVLPQMYDRLYSTTGKKIVIVGGSNVAFGVDTALMERLLSEHGYNYSVCSFGLYAAVGTSAMLDLSKDTLNDSDIVILAIEPTSETMSTYFGASAFWKCAEDAPELLTKLSNDKQAALCANYVPYLQERWSIYENDTIPVIQNVYAKTSFNDRCDMIYARTGNSMALGFDTGSPIDLCAFTIEAGFAHQINEYCILAQQKGADVVMSFSPMNRSAITDANSETIMSFFALCNETFSCPIISDPNSYILDSGWFYDSNFHLNSDGSVVRTIALTTDILAYLGCYQALDYSLPSMPDPLVKIETDGTATGYFEFLPIANHTGYLISGLTEAGLTETVLTVPATHEGKPVVGFSSNALVQADMLEELRLPGSIESLPDYLFQPCQNLTRLVLEHTTGVCSIGEHPFSGAEQLKIFVPSESYALYRDGAGCETNPWAAYLDIIFTYH